MSGAIATAAVIAGGAFAATQMLAPKTPKIPEPAKPTEMPQAAKVADQQAVRAGQAGAGATAGASGTMLTGSGGISNSALNLGKNTLLGQ